MRFVMVCTLRVASDEEPVQRGVKRSRDLPDGLCYVVLDDDKITRLLARKQIAKFGPHPSSIVPTTAAPSTTAAPTATPATGAPAASSPLGGDAVGDRDPNDDPSTDAAAARGVTVAAAVIALFYAL